MANASEWARRFEEWTTSLPADVQATWEHADQRLGGAAGTALAGGGAVVHADAARPHPRSRARRLDRRRLRPAHRLRPRRRARRQDVDEGRGHHRAHDAATRISCASSSATTLYAKLRRYVSELADKEVRGRTADHILADERARADMKRELDVQCKKMKPAHVGTADEADALTVSVQELPQDEARRRVATDARGRRRRAQHPHAGAGGDLALPHAHATRPRPRALRGAARRAPARGAGARRRLRAVDGGRHPARRSARQAAGQGRRPAHRHRLLRRRLPCSARACPPTRAASAPSISAGSRSSSTTSSACRSCSASRCAACSSCAGGASIPSIRTPATTTRRPLRYEARDLELLRIFAAYISSSIQNALDAIRARELARRDDLTGLYNDRFLYRRMTEEIARAERDGTTRVGALPRPRRVQGGQRHLGPPGRQPHAARGRAAHRHGAFRPARSRRATAATSSSSSCPAPTQRRRDGGGRGAARARSPTPRFCTDAGEIGPGPGGAARDRVDRRRVVSRARGAVRLARPPAERAPAARRRGHVRVEGERQEPPHRRRSQED